MSRNNDDRSLLRNFRMHTDRRSFCKGLLGAGAALAAGAMPAAGQAAEPGPKTLVIGFDGMDPRLLLRFREAGVMPNFDRLAAEGGIYDLGTSTPPQSPVAWSNFITGQDPGGHGIYDFLHRNPETMIPFLSTSRAEDAARFWSVGDWKLPRGGGDVSNLRQGEAFWEQLSRAGHDVTIFKIPSNFPPVECDVRSLSGMGTPDILGTYGIFSYFTDDPPADTDIAGGRITTVDTRPGRFSATIPGPRNSYKQGDPESEARFEVVVDKRNPAVTVEIDGRRFLLQEGEWSDWQTLSYEMIPLLKSVSGICRFYLMSVHPHFRLYVSPVQIDPAKPEMPISTPPDYASEIAHRTGPFYTQGLPEDTHALDQHIFSDADYVSQADLIQDERQAQFRAELERFKDLPGGLLFFYFNCPDQSTHMMWRNMDPESPLYETSDHRFSGRIEELYRRMDSILGEALDLLDDNADASGDDTTVMVMSDHGFGPFHRAVHVNTWLLENGYLVLKPGVPQSDVEFLIGVDWRRTRAYALGINGLYLNMREREKWGVVSRGYEREELLAELVEKLEAITDEGPAPVEVQTEATTDAPATEGDEAVPPAEPKPVVKYAYRTDQEFTGPMLDRGPDIIVGYYRGYRGSNESALGSLPEAIIEDNDLAWSGDHCIAADEVPGILAVNRPLTFNNPTLLDMAPTILRRYDLQPPPVMKGRDLFAKG